MNDGGMAISADTAVGTIPSGHSGDIRVGENYGSDQYSQIVLSPTQLVGGQWIGAAVRAQNGGQDLYLGIYFWNNGNPELDLYERSGGVFTQLGTGYPVAPLTAGTVLTLVAVGSQISFVENGIERISVTDSSITGGDPGLMSFGAASVASWNGDDATATNPPIKYSVGGTVSGLSGSVVLQDNGGDDLTVGSDGAFTFDSALANGASYQVSVETQPAGQKCSISNGSGTVSSAPVTVAVTCTNPVPGHDDFDRPDSGTLGTGWTAMNDGGMAISGDTAVGTSSGHSGDIRVAEDYGSDQYSQIVLSSTQLAGVQWIGPAVRAQNGGQNLYLGIYFWNSGSPELDLYERSGGVFTQLGKSFPVAPLPAGTVLTLVAVGSKISFLENGIERISVTDSSITGGDPGLMTFGAASVASWNGDDATAANPPEQFSVGGTVSGLSGSLVLQDSAGDNLNINSNGPFEFQTPLANGSAYHVTITSSPAGQTCTTANADGTISSASVTNIAVTCTSPPPGSDNFDRPNGGSLGAGWAAMNDGGMAISGDTAVGTSSGYSGDVRVGEDYGSDQYSQVVLSSTQLSTGQWIGRTSQNKTLNFTDAATPAPAGGQTLVGEYMDVRVTRAGPNSLAGERAA